MNENAANSEEPDRVDVSWHIRQLENRLAVPEGFFQRLLEEADDWSYVIKAHAFFEAAVAQFVVACLDPRLGSIISALNLNGRGGKMAFARALGLLDKSTARFAERLSAIRNRFAHDVRSAGMQFRDYLNQLDEPGLERAAADLLSPFPFLSIAEGSSKGYDLLKSRTRPIVHFALLAAISDLFYRAHPELQERDGVRGGIDDVTEYAFFQLVSHAFVKPLLAEGEN